MLSDASRTTPLLASGPARPAAMAMAQPSTAAADLVPDDETHAEAAEAAGVPATHGAAAAAAAAEVLLSRHVNVVVVKGEGDGDGERRTPPATIAAGAGSDEAPTAPLTLTAEEAEAADDHGLATYAPDARVRRLSVVRRMRRAESLDEVENKRPTRGRRAVRATARPRPTCREATVLTLAGIPVCALGLAWFCVGWLLTRHVLHVSLVGVGVTTLFYLLAGSCDGGASQSLGDFISGDFGSFAFDSTMYDVPIAAAVATLMAVWGYERFSNPHDLKIGKPVAVWGRQCALVAKVAAVLLTTYLIVKGARFDAARSAAVPASAVGAGGAVLDDAVTCVNHRMHTAIVWSICLGWLLVVNIARWWRPTSDSQLAVAEGELIASASSRRYTARRVAGIHTLEFEADDSDDGDGDDGDGDGAGDGDAGGTGDGDGAATASAGASAGPKRKVAKETLVLVHGFGAGAPLWFRNFDGLAKRFRVIAVDWLGVGRSARPRFPRWRHGEPAERFFVTSLEKWCVEMGLEQFVLCGHSLGGIIVVEYSVQYPHRIKQLILASPATPRPFPEPVPWQFKLVQWAWLVNTTPQRLVRFAGPFGPRLIRALIRMRYSGSTVHGRYVDALAAYIYHSWAGKASGELAMNGVLQPGAAARIPIGTRLVPERVKSFNVTFLYGGGPGEWMSWRQGAAVVDNLRAHGCSADLMFVGTAGHQLFMDEPVAFVESVCEAVDRAGRGGVEVGGEGGSGSGGGGVHHSYTVGTPMTDSDAGGVRVGAASGSATTAVATDSAVGVSVSDVTVAVSDAGE